MTAGQIAPLKNVRRGRPWRPTIRRFGSYISGSSSRMIPDAASA